MPLVRLFSGGQLNRDIYHLILINTRVPEERRGDLNPQIAAARLGVRRLEEVIRRYGAGTLELAFDEIIRRTARRMRDAIAALPDAEYRFENGMDDGGCGNARLTIVAAVTIEDDRLLVDFEGTAPQTDGNIAGTATATLSAIGCTSKALLDAEAPNNRGVLDLCAWRAPEGSLVNAVLPASVANRARTVQRIIDVQIGALAPALPERALAASNGANTTAVFTGTDPATRRRDISFETLGGGAGARPTRDGKDGVQVHVTNTSNLPVEAIEMDCPLRVLEYALVPDSGGAGRYRGGLALRRTSEPVGHVCTFSGSGERVASRPWCIFGGGPGRSGRFLRIEPDGSETALPSQPSAVPFGPGRRIAIETPGAGGYGPPAERDPAGIEADLACGKYTAEVIRYHCG